jgi:4'-phosphopantetheinyl transferase
MRVYWVEQAETDVPKTNEWLCAAEITRLNSLRFLKRRGDWRLGRWTAKRAVAACLNWPPYLQVLAGIEIRATPSGAPDAIVASLGTPMVVSLSHCGGRATCAVSTSGVRLGCDLEVIEPRSEGFVADYFTPEEQALVAMAPSAERPEVVTLLWSAKESALKALREGLRLDTRSVTVSLIEGAPQRSGWSPLCVRCADGSVFQGWWRTTDGIVHTVVADPPSDCPICLALPEGSHNAENTVDLGARMTLKSEIVSVAGQ